MKVIIKAKSTPRSPPWALISGWLLTSLALQRVVHMAARGACRRLRLISYFPPSPPSSQALSCCFPSLPSSILLSACSSLLPVGVRSWGGTRGCQNRSGARLSGTDVATVQVPVPPRLRAQEASCLLTKSCSSCVSGPGQIQVLGVGMGLGLKLLQSWGPSLRKTMQS